MAKYYYVMRFSEGNKEFEKRLVEDCLGEKVFEGEPKKEWMCCYTSFRAGPLIIYCWKKDLATATNQLGIITQESKEEEKAVSLNVSYASALLLRSRVNVST